MPGVSHRARTQLELEVAEPAASESPRRRVPGLPPRQPGRPPRRRAGAGEPPATFPSHPPKKYSLGGGVGPHFSIRPPKEQEEPARDEDVEANLLRPPPCAATLQLRVYRAEDLPQGGHRGGFWEIEGCGSGGPPPAHLSPSPVQQNRLGNAFPRCYRLAARGASWRRRCGSPLPAGRWVPGRNGGDTPDPAWGGLMALPHAALHPGDAPRRQPNVERGLLLPSAGEVTPLPSPCTHPAPPPKQGYPQKGGAPPFQHHTPL